MKVLELVAPKIAAAISGAGPPAMTEARRPGSRVIPGSQGVMPPAGWFAGSC